MIYRFNTITIRTSAVIFVEINTVILKFTWK